MKKIIIVLLITIGIITGCKEKTIEETHGKQNDEIKEELKTLTFGEEEKKYFNDLMILSSNTLRTELGIREEQVENYIAAVSYERNGNYYIIIKPKKEYKERIKSALEIYTSVLKDGAMEEAKQILDKSINTEINGYYVYISSQDNEKVLNIIKDKLK